MKLFIASDHAGVDLKAEFCRRKGVEWVDLGPASADSVNYPDFAQKLCREVLKANSGDALLQPCGVLICGSGVGMSIAANRFEGIRAVLTSDEEIARLSREHNASNILCLGARFTPPDRALRILDTWLATPFAGGRHLTRVQLMDPKGDPR